MIPYGYAYIVTYINFVYIKEILFGLVKHSVKMCTTQKLKLKNN